MNYLVTAIPFGFICFVNVCLGCWRLYNLIRAKGIEFSLSQICLTLLILSAATRALIAIPPSCKCVPRVHTTIFFSLPTALLVISTVLMLFFFRDLTSLKQGATASKFLRTKSSRIGFVLFVLCFVTLDLILSVGRGLYWIEANIALAIQAILYCIIQFLVSCCILYWTYKLERIRGNAHKKHKPSHHVNNASIAIKESSLDHGSNHKPEPQFVIRTQPAVSNSRPITPHNLGTQFNNHTIISPSQPTESNLNNPISPNPNNEILLRVQPQSDAPEESHSSRSDKMKHEESSGIHRKNVANGLGSARTTGNVAVQFISPPTSSRFDITAAEAMPLNPEKNSELPHQVNNVESEICPAASSSSEIPLTQHHSDPIPSAAPVPAENALTVVHKRPHSLSPFSARIVAHSRAVSAFAVAKNLVQLAVNPRSTATISMVGSSLFTIAGVIVLIVGVSISDLSESPIPLLILTSLAHPFLMFSTTCQIIAFGSPAKKSVHHHPPDQSIMHGSTLTTTNNLPHVSAASAAGQQILLQSQRNRNRTNSKQINNH